LHLRYGERALLLTGDAEAEQERELSERYGVSLSADWLKVGHHGSRTSSSAAFLELVDPTLATVSCGVRNRFGHPHPIALETLSKAAIRVLRTDRMGALELWTDGASMRLRAFGEPL
jgi:competence protein ComEC